MCIATANGTISIEGIVAVWSMVDHTNITMEDPSPAKLDAKTCYRKNHATVLYTIYCPWWS